MSDAEKNSSDPARDLLAGLKLLDAASANSVAGRIAETSRTTLWSRDFFETIKLLNDTIDSVYSVLISDGHLDSDDRDDLLQDIVRLRSLFDGNLLLKPWPEATIAGMPAGSETRTFLRTASRQLRSGNSYYGLELSDIKMINGAIEAIRADMDGVKLDKADFAREALLRGCSEVSFIVARIDLFGFSRVEQPIMELGAFLYTVSEEIRAVDGNFTRVKRSMGSLSNVFDRLYKLSKVASFVNSGYDGAQWLITHLSK